MKTAIITGITGQDGSYLSKYLLSKDYKIIGITRDTSEANLKNLKYLGIDGSVTLIKANLSDLSNIIRIVEKNDPHEIYNLAAQSSVGLSFEQPIGTMEFNIISTINLLEAIRIINPKIKFYEASSSEMYGKVDENNLPIVENTVIHPVSPYAISKAAAHWATINYREAYGIFAVCGILFNHESALRGENFVTKKILNTAVKISLGLGNKLTLGNLNIIRDWGYAPEYVKMMWLMLQKDCAEDYIICSGSPNTLTEFAEGVFSKLNLDFIKYVDINPVFYRPVDLKIIYGNNAKAKKNLGWDYNIKLDKLIDLLVEDEIEYVRWELNEYK